MRNSVVLACGLVMWLGASAEQARPADLVKGFEVLEELGSSPAARSALEALGNSATGKTILETLGFASAKPDSARLGLALVENQDLRSAFLSNLHPEKREQMASALGSLRSKGDFEFLQESLASGGQAAVQPRWKFNPGNGETTFNPPLNCGFQNCSVDRLNAYKLGGGAIAGGTVAYNCYEHPDCLDRVLRSVGQLGSSASQ